LAVKTTVTGDVVMLYIATEARTGKVTLHTHTHTHAVITLITNVKMQKGREYQFFATT